MFNVPNASSSRSQLLRDNARESCPFDYAQDRLSPSIVIIGLMIKWEPDNLPTFEHLNLSTHNRLSLRDRLYLVIKRGKHLSSIITRGPPPIPF